MFKRLILLSVFSCLGISGQEDIPIVVPPLAGFNEKLWRKPMLSVCWLMDDNEYQATALERGWVEDSVLNTWQRYSGMHFDFVGTCDSWNRECQTPADISIVVQDVNPMVLVFGTDLQGVPGGMILNFQYNAWDPACRSHRENCTRFIAVHEFGHALGLVHEQDRYDIDTYCHQLNRKTGTTGYSVYTTYDPNSVMNYCNRKWNNAGQLSPLDIEGVNKLYPNFECDDIPPDSRYSCRQQKAWGRCDTDALPYWACRYTCKKCAGPPPPYTDNVDDLPSCSKWCISSEFCVEVLWPQE